MKKRKPLGAVTLLMFAVFAAPVTSAKDNREKQALRRMQMEVQQVRAQLADKDLALTNAEQARDAAEKERDRLKKTVTGAQREASAKRRKLKETEQSLETALGESQTLKEKLQQLETRLAETSVSLTEVKRLQERTEAERKAAIKLSEQRASEADTCDKKNRLLYEHGRGLIDNCQKDNVIEAALRAEPFTGLRRVQLENVLEEYRDKLDAAKVVGKSAGQ